MKNRVGCIDVFQAHTHIPFPFECGNFSSNGYIDEYIKLIRRHLESR